MFGFGYNDWKDFDFYAIADGGEVVITAVSKTDEFNKKDFKYGMKYCLDRYLTKRIRKSIIKLIKREMKKQPKTYEHEWSVRLPIEGSQYESVYIAVYPTKQSYDDWIEENAHSKHDLDVT